MTMAAAIERRTAEAPAGSKASRIAASTSSPISPRPRRSGASSRTGSVPRPISASISSPPGSAGRRARRRCTLYRDRLRRRAPTAGAAAARDPDHMACACALHGRQARHLQHGAVGPGFCPRSNEADLAELLSALREQSGADVLALKQQPRRWQDFVNPMATLPHQPSVNDCPVLSMVPGEPPQPDQQLVPPAAEEQGAQAAVAGLSLLRRHQRRRRRAAAGLVLPRQAAADGRAEAAQRVRRARRRALHPRRLQQPLCRRPRHRHPCARMRRRSDRDLRRRRRRSSLLDDVQHLHDVGDARVTVPA